MAPRSGSDFASCMGDPQESESRALEKWGPVGRGERPPALPPPLPGCPSMNAGGLWGWSQRCGFWTFAGSFSFWKRVWRCPTHMRLTQDSPQLWRRQFSGVDCAKGRLLYFKSTSRPSGMTQGTGSSLCQATGGVPKFSLLREGPVAIPGPKEHQVHPR